MAAQQQPGALAVVARAWMMVARQQLVDRAVVDTVARKLVARQQLVGRVVVDTAAVQAAPQHANRPGLGIMAVVVDVGVDGVEIVLVVVIAAEAAAAVAAAGAQAEAAGAEAAEAAEHRVAAALVDAVPSTSSVRGIVARAIARALPYVFAAYE